MRENRKYCGSTSVLCFACSRRSHFPAVWFGAKAESHSIHWTGSWGWHLTRGTLRRLLYSVTKVATRRLSKGAAAEAVNTLTPLDISHQTVGRMVRTVGDKYAQYEEAQADPAFCSEGSLEKPKYLFI